MSKAIIDGLRHAYEAYCRGDIQGAVDSIDIDPNNVWIEPKEFPCAGYMRHPFKKSLFDRDDYAFQAPFLRTDVQSSQHRR